MSEKEPKAVFDLASIDVEAMKAAQARLDRHQRVLAGSAFTRRMQAELDKVLKLERQILVPLAEEIEKLAAFDRIIAPGKEMTEQLRAWEEVLRPYPETWRVMADQVVAVQQAVDSVMRPFDHPVMKNLLDGLIPDTRFDEYLGLFDFGKLQGFIEQFGGEAEPDEGAEDEPEGAVEFESSIQIQVISAISDALIEHFHRHPEEMRAIKPRLFEELVAELLRGFGFEVELTQQTRDGGRDIIAVRNDVFRTRHLIECKRYAASRAVSVGEVRALLGVLEDERASQGIIATTSHLSPEARQLVERNSWRLGRSEFEELKGWILNYLRRKSAQGRGPLS